MVWSQLALVGKLQQRDIHKDRGRQESGSADLAASLEWLADVAAAIDAEQHCPRFLSASTLQIKARTPASATQLSPYREMTNTHLTPTIGRNGISYSRPSLTIKYCVLAMLIALNPAHIIIIIIIFFSLQL